VILKRFSQKLKSAFTASADPADGQNSAAAAIPQNDDRHSAVEANASPGVPRQARPKERRRRPAGLQAPAAHHRPRGTAERSSHLDAIKRLAADSDFRQLPLDDRILAAVCDLGFVACTPVQAQTMPHSLAGRDVTGRAQTGTGKTAAFLITVLQNFLAKGTNQKPSAPIALVLAPTRELAIQIGKDAGDLGKYSGLQQLVVYGGMNYEQQMQQLAAGVDLVMATPGRLLDYIGKKLIDLSQVRILVIDEADRMLDMGFIPDVRRILRCLPEPGQRQTLLFSATLTEDILRLAQRWLKDPVTVEIEAEQVVAAEVQQRLYAVPAQDKLALLVSLLNTEKPARTLVFRNRRDDCEWLVRQLLHYGVHCALLSGDVPQKKRLKVLENFRTGSIPVIVATDVAGRGIHVEDIGMVVNFDLPYEPDQYVHRIGRTGRAGVKGLAVSFACEEHGFVLPDIEEYIKQPLQCLQPEADLLKLPHPVNPRSGAPAAPSQAGDRRRSQKRSGSSRRGHGRPGQRGRR
jgi:ATP-dependent RNA helicase RhlB